jgi:hypothetical protein
VSFLLGTMLRLPDLHNTLRFSRRYVQTRLVPTPKSNGNVPQSEQRVIALFSEMGQGNFKRRPAARLTLAGDRAVMR